MKVKAYLTAICLLLSISVAQAKIYQCVIDGKPKYQDRPCGKSTNTWHHVDETGRVIEQNAPTAPRPKAPQAQSAPESSDLSPDMDFSLKMIQLTAGMPMREVKALFPAAQEASGGVSDGLDIQMLGLKNISWNGHVYAEAKLFFNDWSSDNPTFSQIYFTNGYMTDKQLNQKYFEEDLAYLRENFGKESVLQEEDTVFGMAKTYTWRHRGADYQLLYEPFTDESSNYVLKYIPK